MKIEKLGKLIIDREIEHNVSKSIENCLVYTDKFLTYLTKNKPDVVDQYITKLKIKIETLVDDSFKYVSDFDFKPSKEPLAILHKHQDLIDGITNLHLSLCKIPENSDWEDQTLTLLHFNVDRGYYHPRFYLAKLLTELLDRDEAIQLFKTYVDQRVKTLIKRPHRETMTEVFELDVKNGKDSKSSAYISALLNEGVYAGRVDHCMGYESLKELNDPELSDLVTCYGDFEMIKKTNKHFVLTRTCTLHTGPYCDNLYHDTRLVSEVKHLPREFYDNLDKKK